MRSTRFLRISAANIGPNRFHQSLTVSWQMSIPRSNSRSSTLRSDSGYFTYIITTRRITSGELSKYRNGFLSIPAGYRSARSHGKWFGLTVPGRGVEVAEWVGRLGHGAGLAAGAYRQANFGLTEPPRRLITRQGHLGRMPVERPRPWRLT